jgi:DNA-binding response OmpR family regulator
MIPRNTTEEEGLVMNNNDHRNIFVVEDDRQIRQLISTYLTSKGFSVISTGKPLDIFKLFAGMASKNSVLLLDCALPETSGPELYEQLHKRYPALKVLFLSGMMQDEIFHGQLPESTSFLQKPFSLVDLTSRLEELTAKR